METLTSDSETGEMDRISQLPEPIIHHILSFLNYRYPRELLRMSVLSKHWFALTASFPILRFRLFNFKPGEISFFKYVDYATSRFCHQNLTAHKLTLFAYLQNQAEVDIVNRCLELVFKNGVRELIIYINSQLLINLLLPYPFRAMTLKKYRLPNILLSVSMLESLTISSCQLPSSFMVDPVKFKSLIKLTLDHVQIDDEVIKYLTTRCPLLQVCSINYCHGLKRFCVYGHQHLKYVNINYETTCTVERIDIEAPNLCNLRVVDSYGSGAPQMNLTSCKKLTTVTYHGHPSPDSNGFTDFLSNFPFIETLFLVTEYKGSNLKLSSHSLRTFGLESKYDLTDIEFNTPNLVSFIYACKYKLPCYSPFLEHSTHLIKACMLCFLDNSTDALWFQRLRLFLDKNNGFKVSNLYIDTLYSQKYIDVEKLQAINLLPYELEHLELKVDSGEESSAHIDFVDAVLWCCRPQSLTLRSKFSLNDFEDLVKFIYEKLLQQGNTEIQIASPSSFEFPNHLRDFKSLLREETLARNTISYIKRSSTLDM